MSRIDKPISCVISNILIGLQDSFQRNIATNSTLHLIIKLNTNNNRCEYRLIDYIDLEDIWSIFNRSNYIDMQYVDDLVEIDEQFEPPDNILFIWVRIHGNQEREQDMFGIMKRGYYSRRIKN